MCDGYDGFDALNGRHYLVDDESGIIMSSIIRKFLLGIAWLSFPFEAVLNRHAEFLHQ